MADTPKRPNSDTHETEADAARRRGEAAAEWQRLRRDIDSGRTGDKVAYPDIATSPLGTDDEAGGSVAPPRPPSAGSAAAPSLGAVHDAQMDRNARRQPGPRDVVPARKKRDRLMLGIGILIGLAFFALMVAL
jgi:hypothetical protein